ncbi:hypothetical protein F444_11979 [Phytophthora nicotianae P1976]|uniref:Uncharacterized protein n=1 Tax=Phytophthora nicotianae P1976 TaxID=1317066 RepID=A0A080ZYI6_PHYNI|nr:hypothetical protein F444_11979 [Phytophthora nicotianae P1976]
MSLTARLCWMIWHHKVLDKPNPQLRDGSRKKTKSDDVAPDAFGGELRAAFPAISTIFSKLKDSVKMMSPHKRVLTKMEDMYERGVTPESLAQLYGPNKKAKFQEQFRQFYKWRLSWQTQ